jgi:hypothetical protein
MTNAQTCAKRRGAGASCSDDSSSCADGLFCDRGGDETCRKLLAAGASCDGGDQCAAGLECYAIADGTRRCQGLPGEGEPCFTGNYPRCARADNYCDASSRCVKLPGPGESCLDVGCIPFAECDYDDGVALCVSRGSLGEPCGEAADYVSCLGHLRCGEGGRCVEPEPEPVCDVPE